MKSNFLLIEDNPCHSTLIKFYALKAGAIESRFYEADSFKKAKTILAEQNINVVLLDLSLPDIGGLDALAEIHALYNDVIIIVLTSMGDESLAAKAVSLGAQDYLVKDMFNALVLAKSVRMAKERVRLIEQLTLKNRLLKKMNMELKLFGSVSCHELKTPVVNLQQLLLAYDASSGSSLEKDRLVNLFRSEVDSLSELMNKVSEVLTIRDRSKMPIEETSLFEVFSGVKNKVLSNRQELESEFVANFNELPVLCFPKGNLELLFQVFLDNAVKFAQPEKPLKVGVKGYMEGDFAVMEIWDNGRGVDVQRFKSKLFDLFQRFHPDVPGRGVGLYLARELVRSYGGDISVESKPDQGARFTLKFLAPDVANLQKAMAS